MSRISLLLFLALLLGSCPAFAAGGADGQASGGSSQASIDPGDPGQPVHVQPGPAAEAAPPTGAGPSASGAQPAGAGAPSRADGTARPAASSWLYQAQGEPGIALDQQSMEGVPVFRTPDLGGFADLLMAALLLVLLIIGGILLHLLFKSVRDDRQGHWVRPEQYQSGPPDKEALDHNNSYLQ